MKLDFKPTPRLLWLTGILVLLGLVSSIWPDWSPLWYGAVWILSLGLVIDLWQVYRVSIPEIERGISTGLSVGVIHDVKLQVKNIHHKTVSVDVFDHFPVQSQVTGLPRRLLLVANEQAQLSYRIKPLQRGLMHFSKVACLMRSPFSLWQLKRSVELIDEVKVYPNYAPVIEYALLSTENHLSMMGILKHRRRGQGMDFHQLREYREGDSLKQVDWKASSRMRKLIAREYQDERDQQVIVMLDCGQRMRAQDGDLSHFDHSLNALLLLAYVALRQGDAVGLCTFSHEDTRWVKPVKGVKRINTLLNAIYDCQPSANAPDYAAGARDLIIRQRKRALVLIVTNLRDDDADDLNSAVQLLKKYHKVVVASLQEQALQRVLAKEVVDLQDALTVSSTHAYQTKRTLLVKQLKVRGVQALDVPPEDLALALTNTYLNLKSSGQI